MSVQPVPAAPRSSTPPNRRTSVAHAFVEASLFGTGTPVLGDLLTTADPRRRPSPFKIYQGLPVIPLDQNVPLRFDDLPPEPAAGVRGRVLSALLYYGYGVSRCDVGTEVVWPLHRFVASARCLFPVEVYVGLPDGDAAPAGVYHYDPLHHRLVQLRRGRFDQRLVDCVGSRPGAGTVLVLSCLFSKTAFQYGDFAYRLCAQEAGLVVGNLMLVAERLGLPMTAHTQFLDEPVNRLLGLRPTEERAFAVVRIGAPGPLPEANSAQPAGASRPPLRARYAGSGSMRSDACARLWQLDRASVLERIDDFVGQIPKAACPGCATAGSPRPVTAPVTSHEPDLADALGSRSSGDMLFQPRREPLAATTLGRLAAAAVLSRDRFDTCPAVDPYWVINRVDGWPAGVYRSCRDALALHPIALGDHRDRLQRLYIQPGVNLRDAPVVAYLVVNVRSTIDTYGNRGFRVMHLAAGSMAQRLSVAAAVDGLAARVSDAYLVRECQTLLRTDPDEVPLFQLIVGRERPGAAGHRRMRMSVRF